MLYFYFMSLLRVPVISPFRALVPSHFYALTPFLFPLFLSLSFSASVSLSLSSLGRFKFFPCKIPFYCLYPLQVGTGTIDAGLGGRLCRKNSRSVIGLDTAN